MIGHENNEEEVTFTVTDRRKFNADGTVKNGVVIEPTSVETAAEVDAPADITEEPALQPTPLTDATAKTTPMDDTAEAEMAEDLNVEDLPGADDPASFINFLSTLATNAAAALGAVPHPATGQRSLDLDTGKYWLDVLAMISDKTKGNLHPKEERLFEGILGDLRMQYVTMVRATEEKLKEQAAKQFSSDDILGKK